ncbi:hypothetical protein [Kineococcus radiotolerans]|uniref:hypothetical protein n=1 Tax=Kineococcus radiotolerans TaxID=131568 RepID=UPI00003A3E9B|nr:hypothetical protein [Kineococcus radiotolerans]
MTGSTLTSSQLTDVLTMAWIELGPPAVAVELLHRTGDWLTTLDAAGFLDLDTHPDGTPRATLRWAEAIAAIDPNAPPGPLPADLPHARHHRGVLRIAAALASAVPVDLGATLGDMDRPTTAHVLAAISRSSQAHLEWLDPRLPDGRPSARWTYRDVGVLTDWPTAPDPPQDTELPLWPARIEEEAVARAAAARPAPLAGLPLSEHVAAVLEHLRPIAREFRYETLGMWGAPGVLSDGVDIDPDEASFTGPCPQPASGEERVWLRRHVDPQRRYLLLVPAGVDLHTVPFHRLTQAGVTTISTAPPEPDAPPIVAGTDLRNPTGGWTVVRIGDVLAQVTHLEDEVTGIYWIRADGQNVGVSIPTRPRQAVERLLSWPGVP